MKRKRPYHHGDLKRALLDAALELIRKVGSEGFTLRQVAQRAGVSHTALYRHFRDKDALLAAVATEGYNYLTECQRKVAKPGMSAYEKFTRSSYAFFEFALQYPEHFKLIFDHPRRYEYPETEEAGERAFGILLGYVAECQAEGSMPQGNVRALGLLYLAMVCGVAGMAITGRLPWTDPEPVFQYYQTYLRLISPLPLTPPQALPEEQPPAPRKKRSPRKAKGGVATGLPSGKAAKNAVDPHAHG